MIINPEKAKGGATAPTSLPPLRTPLVVIVYTHKHFVSKGVSIRQYNYLRCL